MQSDCNEGQVDTKDIDKQAASRVEVLKLQQTQITPSLMTLDNLK